MFFIHGLKNQRRIFLRAWVELVQALLSIMTLGFVHFDWDFKITLMYAKNDMKQRAKEEGMKCCE